MLYCKEECRRFFLFESIINKKRGRTPPSQKILTNSNSYYKLFILLTNVMRNCLFLSGIKWSCNRAGDRTIEQAGDRANDRPIERPSDQSNDRASDQAAPLAKGRRRERAREGESERRRERANERMSERTNGRTGERANEQAIA